VIINRLTSSPMAATNSDETGAIGGPRAWNKDSRPNFKEQTVDERYGLPENFLEIEVRDLSCRGVVARLTVFACIPNYNHNDK